MGLFLVKDKNELDKMVNDSNNNNNFAQRNTATTAKQTLPGGHGGSSRY